MASRILMILVLIMFAAVGLASAAADAPTTNGGVIDGAGTVGNVNGDSDAAPIGGPVPDGVFTTSTTNAPAPSPKGGAAALEISIIAGVAAAVAAIFF